MQTYQLGIDTWEGQLEIDESVLKANGVKFIFVRLNDISGGHHKDALFDKQWKEAAAFYRAPYFVYNPWASAQANYDWLVANMPADAKAVACDIEVVYSGISAAKYAADAIAFRALVAKKWRHVVYTGEWFLSYLSKWEGGDYWWAQYPLSMYPSATQSITWDQLKAKINLLTRPSNENKCPGRVLFWQCAADRYILPGNTRTMDINVFFGTDADLAAFFGGSVAEPTPTDFAELKAEIAQMAGAIATLHLQHGTILSDIANVKSDTEKILDAIATGGTPSTPPASSDGYTGPRMGIYEVIDVPSDPINQQWGGAGSAVPLFDDNGGDRIQIKEQLYDLWMNTLEGFKELVDSGTIVTDEKGFRFILGKAVKGQKLLIAAQGKSDGVMKGMVVGFSNEDNPLVGAVNFTSCTPDSTPWLFNKVKNVRRWIPIMSGNKGNNWWIPMSWLKKVE